MHNYYKTLIFSLLATTSCSLFAATDSFPVELKNWHIKWGDTLSEIAQTLLPNDATLRATFMQKTVSLNPNAFPTNNKDFMLAYQKMNFPVDVNGVNIKTLVTSFQNNPLNVLDDIATEMPNDDNVIRLFSISPSGLKNDFSTGDLVQNDYYYVAQGNIHGQFRIPQGAIYIIEANTKIKIKITPSTCQINIIYGLLRVQDRPSNPKHCLINTEMAQITSVNSDYGVQVCNKKSCVIDTSPEGKATLPAGVYYGVLNGAINISDNAKQYKLSANQFQYYAFTAKKPLNLKPFKGLLFKESELNKLKKKQSEKNTFAWGYIQTNPQSDDQKINDDTIVSDLNNTQFNTNNLSSPFPESDIENKPFTISTPERFNQ